MNESLYGASLLIERVCTLPGSVGSVLGHFARGIHLRKLLSTAPSAF